eukprot:TRINITY_DN15575_c0_g1_i2.p1 TRINITY_DN15575_c0_g1~~TRINITY_DN15575_c0_g1_i2.p1  ORF type:complete len:657 (+),score=81.75 TRINITY_DN15575_c0_g1_i2:363-2333(+)
MAQDTLFFPLRYPLKVEIEGEGEVEKDLFWRTIEVWDSKIKATHRIEPHSGRPILVRLGPQGKRAPVPLVDVAAEAYNITAELDTPVVINVTTHMGFVRALQTLFQMLAVRNGRVGFYGPLSVNDQPAVPYRGFLVDVPRNYWPPHHLRRLIHFMASVKLNVLHFRLSDDQSFMMEMQSVPGLAKPPRLGGFYYTQHQVRQLIAEAEVLGVLVVPEMGLPGHAGGFAGVPHMVPNCRNFACSQAWAVPLAPVTETWTTIAHLWSEMVSPGGVFAESPMLHLGGDEIEFSSICYTELSPFPNCTEWYCNPAAALATFRTNLRQALGPGREKIIIRWEEALDSYDPQDLNKQLFQFWKASESKFADVHGLVSFGFYLNYGMGFPIGCVSMVNCRGGILRLDPATVAVKGGEVCGWEISTFEFDARGTWGRVMGAAERFWSNPVGDPFNADAGDIQKRFQSVCRAMESETASTEWWASNFRNEFSPGNVSATDPTVYHPFPPGTCLHEGDVAFTVQVVPDMDVFYLLLQKFKVHEADRDSLVCSRVSEGDMYCVTLNCLHPDLADYRKALIEFELKYFPPAAVRALVSDAVVRREPRKVLMGIVIMSDQPELLRMQLEENFEEVDKFILIESPYNLAGQDKLLSYERHYHSFKMVSTSS